MLSTAANRCRDRNRNLELTDRVLDYDNDKRSADPDNEGGSLCKSDCEPIPVILGTHSGSSDTPSKDSKAMIVWWYSLNEATCWYCVSMRVRSASRTLM